ncbi:MAG: SDR family NAD(P)-dependent oxidoreductase [Bacteroidales bacterium]|nr:SDR family NAD(P)-dependent oxidoreductase [Bacteroidales bacterium]
MKLENQRILITGASSGIGKILTRELAQGKGNRILAVARHTENIPVAHNIVPFAADFSIPEEIDRTFAQLHESWGGVDICIANAGFAYREKLEEPDWHHTEQIFNLNTLGQIHTLEHFIRMNREASGEKKYFVSLISAVAMVPLPYYALYCASKFALDGFWRTFAFEKPDWLRVLRVYPVATKTAFFTRASGEQNPPLPFLQQKPEQVAAAILRGLRRNRSKVYPSRLFTLFYPLMRAIPCFSLLYSLNEKRKMERQLK